MKHVLAQMLCTWRLLHFNQKNMTMYLVMPLFFVKNMVMSLPRCFKLVEESRVLKSVELFKADKFAETIELLTLL